MTVDPRFIFSQSSIQDYLDCPRRFELKYIQNIKWPAQQFLEEDDYRHFIDLGSQFHRMAHQYFIGIAPKSIQEQINDELLYAWWERFLALNLDCNSSKCFPEITLGGNIANRKVIGKFDLVILQKHKIVIYDWKTSRKTPSYTHLLDRIQTKLYLYLMAEFGPAAFNQIDLTPDRIEMIYWFASNPENPFVIHFDEGQFTENSRFLNSLINEILQTAQGTFKLTNNHKLCKYCRYRSICERGTLSGPWDQEAESAAEDQFDILLQGFQNELEQISETWL